MNRTSFISLPTLEELKQIIDKEGKRSAPLNKQTIHYPNFSTIIALLKTFDLPCDYFIEDLTFADVEKFNFIAKVNELGAMFLDRVLHSKSLHLFDDAYDYLAEEDQIKPADIIFVFGAKTDLRIHKAIELYQKGLGKKLWISGGNPFYQKEDISEAERYRTIATDSGIPASDIIVEPDSITIPDNIRSSLNLMDEMKINPTVITLVNSPYSQRRGYSVFKKHTQDDTVIQRANCATSEKFSREHWFKNKDGITVIFNEFVKTKLTVIFNDS